MYVSWVYQCDSGHLWEYRLWPDEEPVSGSEFCPQDRHEAVTLSRRPQADRVIVELIPAARVGGSPNSGWHVGIDPTL
jgi:hypothetical protein